LGIGQGYHAPTILSVQKKLYPLRKKPENKSMTLTTTVKLGRSYSPWLLVAACLAAGCGCQGAASQNAEPKPPKGFTALFNGQDLTGWRGGDTFDPRKLDAMPADQRAAQIAKWNDTMRAHWRVENGELVNDGEGAYATTEKDYGDFELLVEYKTVPRADSGIYLRGCPQVQIWDYTEKDKFPLGADKGSGGLWNNSPGAPGKDPLVLADKPFGQWNTVRVLMVGARVSVWLNHKLVVNHALLENYYDRNTPVPPKGPIELQTHGGEIRWRNLFIRQIGSDEANRILESRGGAGFKSIFNGRDFTGWAGPTNEYEVVNGAIQCQPHKGGTIYTTAEYTDFMARLEFKLPPGGNNGLAIRYPGHGDTAYEGMCEIQVLDDNYEKATGEKIDPRQAHGSAYGMVAAARGYQHPIGQWNFEEVTIKGPKIKVELNGTVILDCDLSTVKEFMANHPHPGKDRTQGSFGFAGHNDPVAFRNIQIKPL
jgi:3-keto-disaccharide hydrolase